jgi:hypothetical protein
MSRRCRQIRRDRKAVQTPGQPSGSNHAMSRPKGKRPPAGPQGPEFEALVRAWGWKPEELVTGDMKHWRGRND